MNFSAKRFLCCGIISRMTDDEKQFAWAEVMAAGKGLFHDFPIAISKTAVTFNRFGIVTLDKLRWIRWKVGKGQWQKYDKKISYPTFIQLIEWPMTNKRLEPTYKAEELNKLTWERRDTKTRRKAKRSAGKRKKLHSQQAKVMEQAYASL